MFLPDTGDYLNEKLYEASIMILPVMEMGGYNVYLQVNLQCFVVFYFLACSMSAFGKICSFLLNF